MKFSHLHVHTEYSLLDSTNKIKVLVNKAKESGMTSLAITDHGVMYGVVEFYKECKANGIKPIIGCEVYVAPESRLRKEAVDGERYYHAVLLCENIKGYENLAKLVSLAFKEGFYSKPRVDFEILEKYHEGIICLSACLAGEIPSAILKGNLEDAENIAMKYKNVFGENNFFLELQDHGIAEQRIVNMELIKMSKKLNIPLVATNDVHYTNFEDAEAHDVLLCIQTDTKVSDENRMRYEGNGFYLKSGEEMAKLFPYAPEAISNTNLIADRCNVELEFGVTKMPIVQVPDGYTPWTYLNEICFNGLKERYPDNYQELEDQLRFELETIKNMGFVEYFIIVSDFINWAKANDIPVGPGRGSAAGSLVAYTTKITNIDPLKYSLVFERFLNPERVSMPDIDVDFCYNRRGEVIDYVREKYGEEKVTQIITFGTLAARNVIRSVGKVMEFPYAFYDKLAKSIPTEVGMTIEKALTMNVELANEYENNEDTRRLLDICKKLEGLSRHTSMHAAGVVIYPDIAENLLPLSRAKDGTMTTQYNMIELEELGFLKMDFLGLRTLTVIKNAVDTVKKYKNIDIDIDNIDYNDANVLKMIGDGKCNGVFQLESSGMQSFMKELKPQSLEDLIAGISLYRPGPMDFIPKYIAGKNNSGDISYDCPQLEPILAPTYGCIVYQEQVMQIVRDLAGFTWGQSDNIRRAMSKKKQYVIDEERKAFVYGDPNRNIKGCINNGIDENVANRIYDEMVDFAKYAFNKSHAACYAVVGMQTAWLKYYYPTEFYAALITSVIDDAKKVKKYIALAKEDGISILNPDINKSFENFTYEDEKIRFGLVGLKNAGSTVVEAIIKERMEHGDYVSLPDFLERTYALGVDKSTIESLVYAGTFDMFGYTRKTYIQNIPSIIDCMKKELKSKMSGQITLFDMENVDVKADKYNIVVVDEYDRATMLEKEKEVAGMYISGHPLEDYGTYLSKRVSTTLDNLSYADSEDDSDEITYDGPKEGIVVGGIITKVDEKYTKKNQKMAFVTIEDMDATCELVVFPKQYEKYKDTLFEGNKIFVKGTLQVNERNISILVDGINPFNNVAGTIWIRVPNATASMANAIKTITSVGVNHIVVYDETAKKKYRLDFDISLENDCMRALELLYGKGNVVLV